MAKIRHGGGVPYGPIFGGCAVWPLSPQEVMNQLLLPSDSWLENNIEMLQIGLIQSKTSIS